MKNLLNLLIPPPAWRMPVAILLGMLVGLGLYSLKVSNAVSYLSDEPATCVNCHVMTPQYATWQHSSHRTAATCNDCHVPHTNVVSKYYFKAMDGLRHASMFTLRMEPQVIQIKHAGLSVVQENCKRCHGRLNQEVGTLEITGNNFEHGAGKLCWECHREVPHGRVRSLSAAPDAQVPKLSSPVPSWLDNLIDKNN